MPTTSSPEPFGPYCSDLGAQVELCSGLLGLTKTDVDSVRVYLPVLSEEHDEPLLVGGRTASSGGGVDRLLVVGQDARGAR
jgi:hypothetical protein